ncbi:MAG: hypothetical protein D6722_16720, partial [Bacteroidetes bacterium]
MLATALEKNQTWRQSYQAPGMLGTQSSLLEVSALPPLNLGQRLEYLLTYPFGCIEQSTSAGFPLVYLPELMQLDPAQRGRVDDKVRATINRIKLFQTPSGGFAYWPGQSEPSEWGSNYAGHFLLEAQQAGYSVPSQLMTNWRKYLRDEALGWTAPEGDGRNEELTQAYRLFLLALAGHPEVGAMNRLRSQRNLYVAARWNLAAAYHLAGQPEVARQITRQAGMTVPDYSELNGTFGSQVRDQAMMLQALSLMDRRSEATSLVEAISAQLASEEYLNTQATAYALVGMARYAGQGGAKSGLKFSYRIGGGSWTEVQAEEPLWQADLGEQHRGELEVRNRSGALIHPRLILRGVPMQGDTSSAARGLSMDIAYTTLSGQPLRAQSLLQGTDFLAKVTLKNTGLRDYEQMSLAQIFPPGWEIINTRLDGTGPRGDVPTYQDIRDDRVYTFYDLDKGQSKTFIVVLNAAYQGRYYLPTVVSEAMYDPTIHAREGGEP